MIKLNSNEIKRICGWYGQTTRWGFYDQKYIAPTLTASMGEGGGFVPFIFIRIKDDSKNKN